MNGVPSGSTRVPSEPSGSHVELDARRDERFVLGSRQFVLVYTVSRAAKDQAVADVAAAVADGAMPVGADAGLPLHRFPLEQTAEAHAAVEGGAVGKVLIDVG